MALFYDNLNTGCHFIFCMKNFSNPGSILAQCTSIDLIGIDNCMEGVLGSGSVIRWFLRRRYACVE